MISFEVKVTGDIAHALDRYAEKIKQQMLMSGVAETAEVMYDEVRRWAMAGGPKHPDVQEGDLRDAIYRAYIPERSTGDQKVYFVGARNRGAFYWRFLEYGTSRMPAQPFLRPSLDRLPSALKAGLQRMRERGAQT